MRAARLRRRLWPLTFVGLELQRLQDESVKVHQTKFTEQLLLKYDLPKGSNGIEAITFWQLPVPLVLDG